MCPTRGGKYWVYQLSIILIIAAGLFVGIFLTYGYPAFRPSTLTSTSTLSPTFASTYTPTLIPIVMPTLTGTYTPVLMQTPTRTCTPTLMLPPTFTAAYIPTTTRTPTSTIPSYTPNPTQTLLASFNEIDIQFQESLKSNIVYIAPETMRLDETVTIELLLNPSLSQEELATQVVKRSGLATSTAEPGKLVTEERGEIVVVASEIEITNRMKAVLISQDPDAFTIQELHDSPEQTISSIDTTKWRWSVTAQEEGTKTLELVIYRLIKYEGQDYWHEVETYKANIIVKVTFGQRLKSLDWKWIIGIIVTLILIPLFWRWYDRRKKAKMPYGGE